MVAVIVASGDANGAPTVAISGVIVARFAGVTIAENSAVATIVARRAVTSVPIAGSFAAIVGSTAATTAVIAELIAASIAVIAVSTGAKPAGIGASIVGIVAMTGASIDVTAISIGVMRASGPITITAGGGDIVGGVRS